MTQTTLYPDWREKIVFDKGPQHQELMLTDTFRAVLVSLEAGQKIAPHTSSSGAYHILEGTGSMIVDGERLAIEAGATIVVPKGAARGVEAETRLVFLGTQAVVEKKALVRKPLLAIILMVVVMFALMSVFSLMLGSASPISRMFSNSSGSGLGMWSMMLIPMAGLVLMFVMMFFMFRWMTGRSGPMSGAMDHGVLMSMMMRNKHASITPASDADISTLTYTIPAVNCAHSKMKIEREVSKFPGVASVSVAVDTQQAVVNYGPPASEASIEALLVDIGYPPDK